VSRGPQDWRSRLPWTPGPGVCCRGLSVPLASPGNVTPSWHSERMGIERSAARRKRDNRRAQRDRQAQTWGGPVEVRKVGDPEPESPPAAPSRRVAGL
jgi:hypothetical protein